MTLFATLFVGLCLAILLWQPLFHTSAFTASTANVANTDTGALTDQIIPISNSHFLPYRDYKLFMAYSGGATLVRSRLNSGTIRQVNPSYLRPISTTQLPGNNPNICWLRNNPFTVHAREELQNETTQSAVGPTQVTTLIWLESRYDSNPRGDIFSLRYTGTTAAVANTWTVITYALETGLPAGTYAVVWHEHQATNALATRIIFDNQIERPGNIGLATLTNRLPYIEDRGPMGLFGSFYTYSLPRLEHLNGATDAAYEGYFHVIKTG